MSWNVRIAAMERGTLPGVMDEHRRSRGGVVPDAVVDMILAETSALAPQYTNVEVVTYGHMTSDLPDPTDGGQERTATFSIRGSA